MAHLSRERLEKLYGLLPEAIHHQIEKIKHRIGIPDEPTTPETTTLKYKIEVYTELLNYAYETKDMNAVVEASTANKKLFRNVCLALSSDKENKDEIEHILNAISFSKDDCVSFLSRCSTPERKQLISKYIYEKLYIGQLPQGEIFDLVQYLMHDNMGKYSILALEKICSVGTVQVSGAVAILGACRDPNIKIWIEENQKEISNTLLSQPNSKAITKDGVSAAFDMNLNQLASAMAIRSFEPEYENLSKAANYNVFPDSFAISHWFSIHEKIGTFSLADLIAYSMTTKNILPKTIDCDNPDEALSFGTAIIKEEDVEPVLARQVIKTLLPYIGGKSEALRDAERSCIGKYLKQEIKYKRLTLEEDLGL